MRDEIDRLAKQCATANRDAQNAAVEGDLWSAVSALCRVNELMIDALRARARAAEEARQG